MVLVMRSVEDRKRTARESSRAAETRRTYASLWRGWSDYAILNNLPVLPATEEHVGRYFEHSAKRGDRIKTVQLRRCAISGPP